MKAYLAILTVLLLLSDPGRASADFLPEEICSLDWGYCVLPCFTGADTTFRIDYNCVQQCNQSFDDCLGDEYDCPDSIPCPPWSKAGGAGEFAVATNGHYFPRFDTGNPTDSLVFDLNSSENTLRVGRWHQSEFLNVPGAVTRVAFYEVPAETLAAYSWTTAPWNSLGDGTFNAGSGRWELRFTPAAGDPHQAHVFVAQVYDPTVPQVSGGIQGQMFALVFGVSPNPLLAVDRPAVVPVDLRLWPSPVMAGAHVYVELASPTRADDFEIGVYDLAGRHVAVVARGLAAAPGGTTQVIWDGRGRNGRPVAASVYFVRASRPAERHSVQSRLVVLP